VAATGTAGAAGAAGAAAQPTVPPPDQSRQVQVAAVAVAQGFAAAQLIVPPAMAKQLGLGAAPAAVLASNSRPPTDHEQQVTRGALHQLDAGLSVDVETGYHNPSIWLLYALIGAAAIIAVGAATIATALANVDGRPDLITLGAVGASPRTRRVLSMSRAAVIAGVGTVLGTVAGFVPAIAWVHALHRSPSLGIAGGGYVIGLPSSPSLRLVVPWLPIATVVVAIPVLAALIAATFTRSRLPSELPAD
jgi:putative ABC transport system permease protein